MGTELSERRSGEQLPPACLRGWASLSPYHSTEWARMESGLLCFAERLVPLSPFERNLDCLCSESSGLLALWAS